MDEKDTPREDGKLNLHDESGMTRRDLMRRGAVVGGTLLWVAPAIQSIGSKAYAAVQGPSPGDCAACYCFTVDSGTGIVQDDECNADGVQGARFSADACENFCKGAGYEDFQYCSGNTNCQCTQGVEGVTPPGGVVCV